MNKKGYVKESLYEYSKRDIDDLKVKDLNNPNCEKCNHCCSLFTKITEEEFLELKKFLSRSKRGKALFELAVRRYNSISNEQNAINMLCPFTSTSSFKCAIYNKRPSICKEFHCKDADKWNNAEGKEFRTKMIYHLFEKEILKNKYFGALKTLLECHGDNAFDKFINPL